MSTWKRVFLIFETAAMLLLCTGCWNYRDIEKTTIVAGMAVDKGTNGHKYHMTYEVLSFSGGNEQSVESSLLSSDGDTVFEAIRRAVNMADKKLYFSNCNLVIVSKDVAKEGVAPLMDFLIRDAETRITTMFVVSDEAAAADILSVKLKTKEPVAFKIRGELEQSRDSLGHILPVPLFQMYNILSSSIQDLTLPCVAIEKVGDNPQPKLTLNAVFKGDKLAGYMPGEDALYYLVMKNKIKSGLLMTGIPYGEKDITLEIFKSEAKLTPIVNGNDVTMKIKIKMLAGIGEESAKQQHYGAGDGNLKLIESTASRTLKEGTERLIADMQGGFDADVLGFGEKVKRDQYRQWVKTSRDWEKMFPEVKCDVEADVMIASTGVAYPKEGA